MTPRGAVAVVSAVLVAVTGGTAHAEGHAASKKLTQARAERAIAKKVRSAYRGQVGGREVQVGCRRVSARHYRCEYGVLTGATDDTDEQDRDPYAYEGTGSVKQSRKGALVVRVTKPR